MKHPPLQLGVTLVELMIAMSISAIVLAAINGLVKLGADAQTSGRTVNELAYQGRFALERITERARVIAPKPLAVPVAGTTGDWFAPAGCAGAACIMYCLNASAQLIESTTADVGCAGTAVIAGNVSAFTATLPASAGSIARSIAMFDLTLADGATVVTLSSSVRLGGGTL